MTQEEIDFFDRIAPEWDENEIRSTPIRIRSILSRLPIESGMKVLDLGTGTGVLIPYLSEIVGEAGEVVGLDMSEGMLSQARSKFGALPNVRFYRIDFEEEQIPGTYDVVLLYSVYPHLHSPRDTFEWLFKMNIRPGGVIVIAFPSDERFINDIHHQRGSDSDHLLPAHELAMLITDWGFQAEVVSSTEDEYIVSVRRRESVGS